MRVLTPVPLILASGAVSTVLMRETTKKSIGISCFGMTCLARRLTNEASKRAK